MGLSPRWYMGAYSIYMQTVFPRVLAAFEYDRKKREQAINALLKLISLDQEIALLMYFGEEDEDGGLSPWRTLPRPVKASGG